MFARFLRCGIVISACVLAFASSANAGIVFDPDGSGTGPSFVVDAFDILPGNLLSTNVVPAVVGDKFVSYYQAKLGSLVQGNSPLLNTGLNVDFEITIVAGFEYEFIATGPNYSIYTNAAVPTVNFLEVWYDPNINSNNLAGTGFNDGQLILTASMIAAGGSFFGAYIGDDFDAYQSNDYPGIKSVSGAGGATIIATVDSFDPNFFLNAPPAILEFAFFNTSNIAPFRQVDPSQLFVSAPGGVAPDLVPNIGTINGLNGLDFQLQSDAVASFTVVPEASSLTLYGLGCLVLVVGNRLRRKQN